MSKPATDAEIAGISFTDDGVISPWRTRNEAMRSLIARIRQEHEYVTQACARAVVLRAALESLIERGSQHGWVVVARQHKRYRLDVERSSLIDAALDAGESSGGEVEG